MSHVHFYCLTVMLAFAAAAARLPMSAGVIVGLAGLAICLIGVPHGGLDHWKGRRWLQPTVGPFWAPIFFGGYLMVGCAVVAGWIWFPVTTVLGFFAISAWHFGREDQHLRQLDANSTSNNDVETRSPTTAFEQHLTALALGGIVIWVPAVARPAEMQRMLSNLIPGHNPDIPLAIVGFTTFAAAFLLPCGCWFALRQWSIPERRPAIIAASATGLLAATAPIICSFTIYFCGWHSIRGLQRLRGEEQLSWNEMVLRIAPMSLGATFFMAAIALYIQQTALSVADPASIQQSTGLKMLFVGLSAIAVPHLFLHELCETDDAHSLSIGGGR